MTPIASLANRNSAPIAGAGKVGVTAAPQTGQAVMDGRSVRGLAAVDSLSWTIPMQAAHPPRGSSPGGVSLASRSCKVSVFDRALYLKQQEANEDAASFKQSVLLNALQDGKVTGEDKFFSDALSFVFASGGPGLSERGLKVLLQALPRPLPETGPQFDTLRDGLKTVVMAFVLVEAEGPDFLSRMSEMAGVLQSQLAGSPELLKACLDGMDWARSSAPGPQPPATPADRAQKLPAELATSGGEAPLSFRIKDLPEEWQPSAASVASVRLMARAVNEIPGVLSNGKDSDAVQPSVQAWCVAACPKGMRPQDIKSVFHGFAQAADTGAPIQKTVAGVKGLVDALGGATMSHENANCLIDLLHSGKLTPAIRKQVVGYLGQLTGKSPDGSSTELHKAIQGEPSKFGSAGLYRPGWLGDWPRGEMAGLFKHYHACAQTSYVSSRKVEHAYAAVRAQMAEPTAQSTAPEEIPRAWAPYDPGPLVLRPVMEPVPGSSGFRNPAGVRRDLELRPPSQASDRGPTQEGPAILPSSLEPSPSYDQDFGG